jgi:hypothetical protein
MKKKPNEKAYHLKEHHVGRRFCEIYLTVRRIRSYLSDGGRGFSKLIIGEEFK